MTNARPNSTTALDAYREPVQRLAYKSGVLLSGLRSFNLLCDIVLKQERKFSTLT